MPQYIIGDTVQINGHCYTIAGEPYRGGCADVYPLENEGARSDLVLKVYNPRGFAAFGQTLINSDVMNAEKNITAAVGNDTFQSPVRIVAAEKNMFIETKLPDDLVSLQKLQGKFKDFTDYERVRASLYIMLSLARFLERLVELGYAHLDLSLTNVFAADINFKSDRLDAVTALVIDFGISRELGTSVEIPAHSGTEPPEYRDVNEYVVSEKTDVYGVGQLLYCLIFNASQYNCDYLEDNCCKLDLSQPVKDEIKKLICRLTDHNMENRPSIGGEEQELYHALDTMIQILEKHGFHQALALEKSRELYEHEWQAKFGANDDFNESLVCRPKDWDAFNTESNALLLGEGGSGKSTLLLLLWKKLIADATLLPLYVPLHTYKTYKKEKGSSYISSEVKRLYFPAEEECLPANFFADNRCILLLDGLDEAEDPSGGLQEEIANLSSAAVICIASRQDYQWEATKDFKTWYLEPLPLETVADYLKEKNLALPKEETTVQLLRFPFFLKIYSKGKKRKADILQAHIGHLLDQFKRGYPCSDRLKGLRQAIQELLPRFAFENGRTFEVKTFLDDEMLIENILPTGLLIGEDNGGYIRYTFKHQIFADFFAAKYVNLELQVVEHNAKFQPETEITIPDSLCKYKISDEVLSLFGEILGECAGKPSKIAAVLHLPGFVENKYSNQAAIATLNLVEAMKLCRGNDLDEVDFSALDLRLVSFANCSLHGCNFLNAQFDDDAFFSSESMIKVLSVTNNGSVIVLSRNHYIAVYEHRFGQCIFREATDFSDAYYVSGNLLLLAARSGGITWFDTESLKTGQINGIDSHGIKKFFVNKLGSSLAVCYDNTVKIAFYRLTCKDSGCIASEKWVVTLNSALLPMAVVGMSMQDHRLLVVVRGLGSYFYILLDTATGEAVLPDVGLDCDFVKVDTRTSLNTAIGGISTANLKDGKLIQHVVGEDVSFLEYDLFKYKEAQINLGKGFYSMKSVVMSGTTIAGVVRTAKGDQIALKIGGSKPFIKKLSQYGDNTVQYANQTSLSDSGQYFALFHHLSNAFPGFSSGYIEVYRLWERAAYRTLKVPVFADVTVSAYNSHQAFITSSNGLMTLYDGTCSHAFHSFFGLYPHCTWIDDSNFYCYTRNAIQQLSKEGSRWSESSSFHFPETQLLCLLHTHEDVIGIKVSIENRTAFVAVVGSNAAWISSLYVFSHEGELMQCISPPTTVCKHDVSADEDYSIVSQLENLYIADAELGCLFSPYIYTYKGELKQRISLPTSVYHYDVSADGKYLIISELEKLHIYKRSKIGYVHSETVILKLDGEFVTALEGELIGSRHLLLDDFMDHRWIYNIETKILLKIEGFSELKSGSPKQLANVLCENHICYKRKTGFVYIQKCSDIDDGMEWQVFSVLLDEDELNFAEEYITTVKTKDSEFSLHLSFCEDALFLIEGTIIQIVRLDEPGRRPTHLAVTKTLGLSGARFSSNVDPTLKGYLEQNGAVFEE